MRILCAMLSVPQNNVMDINNVMPTNFPKRLGRVTLEGGLHLTYTCNKLDGHCLINFGGSVYLFISIRYMRYLTMA